MIVVWIDGKQFMYGPSDKEKVIEAVTAAIRADKYVEVIPDC